MAASSSTSGDVLGLVRLTYRERRMRAVPSAGEESPRWRADPSAPWSAARVVVAANEAVAQLLIRSWSGRGTEVGDVEVTPIMGRDLEKGTLIWISDQAGYRWGCP